MSSSKMLAGRYELIGKIGDGGMAVVYKAKDLLLNRYVAIKILRPEFTKDEQFIENFKKESQAAAGLQHPNIVGVYDVGKEGSIYYIVMELIDGRPLSDLIEEHGPFDYKQVVEIGKQVASALSLAHKNHIIHRDVKPHNIMITKDGVAKLADFGIAKAVTNSTIVNTSESNRVMGSVHYFSPEQARGKYVDEKSDVYSLGIVLYEMLTGRVPFDGDNAVQIALMHMNDEIIPPSELVGSVPPTLESIIMKSTDKFQNNRYNNAEELYEELSGVDFLSKKVGDGVLIGGKRPPIKIKDENTAMVADIFEEKPKKKKKKSKIGLFIALGVVLAILLAGGGYFASTLLSSDDETGDIEVPDVREMTYEEAKAELEDANLKIKKGETRASAEVEKDKIISQTPIAGRKVKKGTVVKVTISKGKESGVIPTLVGQKYDYDEISQLLGKYGFKLGEVTKEDNDEVEEGFIVSQDPKEGATAKEGAKINIVVSKGSKKAKVPSLTGLNSEQAEQALINAGLKKGRVTTEESNVYTAGFVMKQQYEPGTELKKGTEVGFTLSKVRENTNNTTPGGNNPNNGSETNPTPEAPTNGE